MNERHTLDVVSLVFGLIFIALALPVMLAGTPLHLDGRWLWPTAVIIAGLIIAGSALRPNRRTVQEIEGTTDDE